MIISVYLIVTTLRSMVDLVRARDKLTRRDKELAALLSEHEDLLRQQNGAEDPGFLEKVARDQLGMAKPGEEEVVIAPELLRGVVEASAEAVPNWKKWLKLIYTNW